MLFSTLITRWIQRNVHFLTEVNERPALTVNQTPQRPSETSRLSSLFREKLLKEGPPAQRHCNSISKTEIHQYVSLLEVCTEIKPLKLLHAHIIANGFYQNVFLGTKLVKLYAKCGSLENARFVFDKIHERNVFLWNAMVRGYAWNGPCEETLVLYSRMQSAGIEPDNYTFSYALKACASLSSLEEGKHIHCHIVRAGFEVDVFVGAALIDMYCKCGCIDDARHVFDKMPKRDVVSWTAMIAGYAQNGHANDALTLFHQMRLSGLKPDSVTMASVLPACAHLGALQQGKWLHEHIHGSGLESNVFVKTALIDMYAKCGNIDTARQLFDKMAERNVVTWGAMITGYAQNGRANEALKLFNLMQQAGVEPNSATMVSVLSAYAHIGALQQSKWIHTYIMRNGFESDVFIGTALIDMYAKCGRIEIAHQLFEKLPRRNVASWNAIIVGCGMHGHGEDALTLFNQMQQTGMTPNHITFIGVLLACSHAGLVNEGYQYFDRMSRDHCISPQPKHYACMVDLLGRSGQLNEAHDFIKRMPIEADAAVWGSLLGACRIHWNVDLGECVAKHLLDLEPENSGYYVLLSNIYAAGGRWDEVANVRSKIKGRKLKKIPGCSLIEINNTVHAFHVGDKSHPQSDKIYAMVETLYGKMKEAGYVPNTNFVLHDVEEEVKERLLCFHSEKLAIAFGLINTAHGTPIWITKNLRVCGDCHSATKFISKIVNRKITVRDANRFHHFDNGLCSCGDYW